MKKHDVQLDLDAEEDLFEIYRYVALIPQVKVRTSPALLRKRYAAFALESCLQLIHALLSSRFHRRLELAFQELLAYVIELEFEELLRQAHSVGHSRYLLS